MSHEPRTASFGPRRWRLPCLLCLLAPLGMMACGSARSSGADATPVEGDAPPVEGAGPIAAQYDIPPDFLPPPGQCRVWEPGEPPDPQRDRYPIGRCSQLREAIPDGAWLVYRPTDDAKHVRVWLYGSDREVLQQRIYDVETGELVRHIAPASGN